MNESVKNSPSFAYFTDARLVRWRARYRAIKLFTFLRFPRDSRNRKRLRHQLIEASELGLLRHIESLGIHADAEPGFRLPTVSAIVPNYNHARFLEQRIQSILNQRSPVQELIILDDASTDDSIEVINRIIAVANVPCRVIRNDVNSGSVFKQWQKGLSVASGDIIWICESDDDCDAGFLEALVPYFTDPSVMLAFGSINSIDQDGRERKRSDASRQYSNFFDRPRVANAHAWFNGPFAARCIIRNVGGCIFRRQNLADDVRSQLITYRTCGDWFLYSRLARGGKIVFDPKARASFRVHGNNTSVLSFKTVAYYRECIRVLRAFQRHYEIDRRIVRLALENIFNRCAKHLGRGVARAIISPTVLKTTMMVRRTIKHVIVSVDIADVSVIRERTSALTRGGDDTSLLVNGRKFAHELRSELPGEIAIFIRDEIANRDPNKFAKTIGATAQLQWRTQSEQGHRKEMHDMSDEPGGTPFDEQSLTMEFETR